MTSKITHYQGVLGLTHFLKLPTAKTTKLIGIVAKLYRPLIGISAKLHRSLIGISAKLHRPLIGISAKLHRPLFAA